MASVAPAHGSYWGVTFPSLLLVISGPGKSYLAHDQHLARLKMAAKSVDLSFSTGQLIVSNAVPREHQGIAGELTQKRVMLKRLGGIVAMITNYSYVHAYAASTIS